MKKDKSTNYGITEEYEYIKPISAQDCTGLIPAAPEDDSELENYEELYPFLPQVPNASKCKLDESAK